MSEQTHTPVPQFQTRAEALGVERTAAPAVPAAVPVPPPAAPRPVPPPAAVPTAVPVPPAPAAAAPAVPAPPAPSVPAAAPAPAPAPSAPEPVEEPLSALDQAALNDEAYVVHDDPWADVTNADDGSITLTDPPATTDEDDEDESDTPKKTSPRRNAAKDRALVRKTVAKVLEVQAASADLVAVAASILGVNPDNTGDLTVAIVTANSRDLQVVTDLKTILDADALEAGVTATGLGRARLRAVWKLLAGLGGVAGEMPSSDAKAAIALVKALHAGDSAAIRSRVDAAVDLLRK